MENKPWYASQTVWSSLGAVGAGLGAAYHGYTTNDTVTMSAGLTAAFAGIGAVVGRFKANASIVKPAVK